MGFYQGKVYSGLCNSLNDGFALNFEYSIYTDLMVASPAYAVNLGNHLLGGCFMSAIMQPNGIGMVTWFALTIGCFWPLCDRPHFGYGIGVMHIIEDNWTASQFGQFSISPNKAEQGTTLTHVRLCANNNDFQGIPFVNIVFDPSIGLTVSNINFISNTAVEFDLYIAVDAPIGFKNVFGILSEPQAFEVLEKSF